jgi:hypothetical protein
MKIKYPPADPAHLCECPCHEPDSSMMHFDACCSGCDCGAPIRFDCYGEHKKTCKPTKNRHKEQNQ